MIGKRLSATNELIELLQRLYQIIRGPDPEVQNKQLTFEELKQSFIELASKGNSQSKQKLCVLGAEIASTAALIKRAVSVEDKDIDNIEHAFFENMMMLYSVKMWLSDEEDSDLVNQVHQAVVVEMDWSKIPNFLGKSLVDVPKDVIASHIAAPYLSPNDIHALAQASKFFGDSQQLKGVYRSKHKPLVGGERSLFYIRNGQLYGMGVNSQGQLGLGEGVKEQKTPVRIPFFEGKQVLQVVAGKFHTLVLCEDGLYGMGSNDGGKLGLGEDVLYQKTPVLIPGLEGKQVLQMDAGYTRTLIFCKDGLYGMGFNLSGELGLEGEKKQETLKLIPFFEGKSVLQVASELQTLILCEDGLYGMGFNLSGELGLGEGVKEQKTPVRIPFFEGKQVLQVAAGQGFTLVLCTDGLYGMGSNVNGELGLGEGVERELTPVLIPGFEGKQVLQMAAETHALILCKDGLYGMGDNTRGLLGLGEGVRYQRTPERIPFFEGEQVRQMASGGVQTMVLCENGLYCMGMDYFDNMEELIDDSDDEEEFAHEVEYQQTPAFVARSLKVLPEVSLSVNDLYNHANAHPDDQTQVEALIDQCRAAKDVKQLIGVLSDASEHNQHNEAFQKTLTDLSTRLESEPDHSQRITRAR